MPTIRGRKPAAHPPPPDGPEVSLRALVLIMAAGIAGMVALEHPEATNPALVALGAFAALNGLVKR